MAVYWRISGQAWPIRTSWQNEPRKRNEFNGCGFRSPAVQVPIAGARRLATLLGDRPIRG
jgi:hypothetical protein